jgi:N-acetyl-anhydromuramyl-L-alanine amidase AmpD
MTDLRFDHLRSTRPRREPARAIVLHWTGGIGDEKAFYRTMRSRVGPRTPDGLSVHYFVDAAGKVVQMASHSLVCLHAGPMNESSIGIEIQNPATVAAAYEVERRKRSVNRPMVGGTLRGRTFSYRDFTVEQRDAVVALVDALCDEMKIPRAVPEDGDGGLLLRTMSRAERDRFSGVMGHWHCHPTKIDPGPNLLEHLRQRWSERDLGGQ